MKRTLFLIFILSFLSCDDVHNSSNFSSGNSGIFLLSYDFDESSGTAVLDSSGNICNGTLSDASRTDGKVNQAVSFPLSNSVIILNDFYASFIKEYEMISIYSWIKLSELDSSKRYTILADYQDYHMSISIVNNYFTILYNSVVLLQSTTTLETNKWIHFVLTSDGNYITLYLDGEEDCKLNSTFPISNVGAGQCTIGGRQVYGSMSFPYIDSCLGVIDEFNILKIALTSEEVLELYSQY